MARQWFAEGVQVHEDGTEEYFAEGVQVVEDQGAAPGGLSIPIAIYHRRERDVKYIRQGATHKVVIGPAVAVGDGFTPVTTLALTTADEAEVILHDNGTVVDISGYTWAAITTADGYYHLTLQSGISGTVGHVTVVVNDDSLCLPLRQDFTVLEEAVYDALFAASAPGYLQPTTAGRTLDVSAGGEAGVDWANVGSPTTSLALTGTTIATTQKVDVETIKTQAVTLSGGVTIPAATLASTTNITGGTITTVTNLTNAPTAGDLTAAMKASVNAEVDTALSDYDGPTRAELTSDINSVLARLRWVVIVDGTIGATGNDTTHVHLPGLTYGNDEINGYMLVVYDVSEDEYHWRKITDWVLATELATVDALPFTPQNSTDTYALLASLADASVTGGDATAANQATIISLLGTPADTDLATDIANVQTSVDDVPTVAEFEARTIVSANYATTAELAKVPKSDGTVSWNATAAAQIQSEANDAIVANRLDHLVAVADADDVVDNSIIAKLVSSAATADWSGFVNTTDSLQAIRDRGDAAWVTATSVTVSDKTGFKLASDGLALVTAWTVDITGSLSGSVGSVTGAVGSVTGAVGSVTGNVGGNVVGSVASVTGAVGSVAGNVGGNVVGSVASVTNRVTANTDQIAGSATAATNQKNAALVVYSGTVTSNSTTTTLIDTGLTQVNDHWNGRVVIFLTGTLAYQAASISDFDAATDTLTLSAMTSAPQSGDTYIVV